MNVKELISHGWWYICGVSKTNTMADGSPRVQIDAGEEMIDTEGFFNFARAQKDRKRLLLMVIPMDSEIAEDLIEELRKAEYGEKTEEFSMD